MLKHRIRKLARDHKLKGYNISYQYRTTCRWASYRKYAIKTALQWRLEEYPGLSLDEKISLRGGLYKFP